MTQEQWQVAGDASEIYEKYLVPAYFLEWAQLLINSTTLKQGARVLDVACGTGIVARTAARIVGERGKVVGLDLNPGMLAVARKETENNPVDTEWHQASAIEMPLSNGDFDNVFCQAGIMFFPDRPAALSEMYRVLVPGGGLAASVWRALERAPGFAALARAMEKHVGPDAAAIVRSAFVFDTTDELHKLMHEAGFDNVRIILETRMVRFPSVEAFFTCYAGASPLASHVANIDNREKLISEMADQLSPYLDDDGLAFPIEGLIVTAIK